MPTLTASHVINRPAREVWAIVADYDRDPEWRKGVETMAPSAPGPVIKGLTTDEILHLGRRTYRNAGVVTAVDPGTRFAWRTTSGADADGSRTVRDLGDGRSEVTLVLTVRPHGVERLLQPVLMRMLRSGLAADLGRLAQLASAAAVAA